jgi:hypothetical protein
VAPHPPDTELPDGREDQVLRRDAEAEFAGVVDAHRLGLALDQALGGEDVLHLGGADPERQRTEGAVGRGMGVAADDRQSRLGHAQLGADHVDDAAPLGAERVERDPKLLAVALQGLHLPARELIRDKPGDGRSVSGHIVIGRREGLVGPPHLASGETQPVERLRRGDLVNQMEVDVDQVAIDLVCGPDLLEEVLGHRSS